MFKAEKGHIIKEIACTILEKYRTSLKFVLYIITVFLCSILKGFQLNLPYLLNCWIHSHIQFFVCFTGSNRLAPAVAILNPVQVHHAERGWRNSRGPVVVVFVNV